MTTWTRVRPIRQLLAGAAGGALCAVACALALGQPARAQTVVGPTTLTIEDALAAHGDWVVIPNQGPVWFPRVGIGWVPQRDGQWNWVDQLGWVWVEAAPWGAYVPPGGRWMEIDRRWAWVPHAPPRSIVVPVPGMGQAVGPGGVPRTVPPNLSAPVPVPRPMPLPGVIRPEPSAPPRFSAPGASPGGPWGGPSGGAPFTRPPVVEQPAPPVIGGPVPYPGYYPGPMIQRPDAVPPPARVINPPPGRAEVPTRPATPYPPYPPGGQATGPVYPAPMPWGGATVVVPLQPQQPQQYRTVPGR